MSVIYMEQTLNFLAQSGQQEKIGELIKQGKVVEYQKEDETSVKYLRIEEDEI